jgi:hypothetical protein
VRGASGERSTPEDVLWLKTCRWSCAVKDVLFPLALFVTLHAAFIGVALAFYVR